MLAGENNDVFKFIELKRRTNFNQNNVEFTMSTFLGMECSTVILISVLAKSECDLGIKILK